jgi:hypothetical protein
MFTTLATDWSAASAMAPVLSTAGWPPPHAAITSANSGAQSDG